LAANTPVPLEPVDAVSITTLVDNFVDVLMMDDGPAKRMGLPTAATPRVPAAFLETGETADSLALTSREYEARPAR